MIKQYKILIVENSNYNNNHRFSMPREYTFNIIYLIKLNNSNLNNF